MCDENGVCCASICDPKLICPSERNCAREWCARPDCGVPVERSRASRASSVFAGAASNPPLWHSIGPGHTFGGDWKWACKQTRGSVVA